MNMKRQCSKVVLGKLDLLYPQVMSSNVKNNALFIEQLSFEAWLIILILFTSVENEQWG